MKRILLLIAIFSISFVVLFPKTDHIKESGFPLTPFQILQTDESGFDIDTFYLHAIVPGEELHKAEKKGRGSNYFYTVDVGPKGYKSYTSIGRGFFPPYSPNLSCATMNVLNYKNQEVRHYLVFSRYAKGLSEVYDVALRNDES